MADFKVVWEFDGPGGVSFNEVYYRTATDVSAATAFPGFLSGRLDLLHPLNRMARIRAASVAGNRVTAVRTVNFAGSAPGDSGPVAPGLAAVCNLTGTPRGRRKLWMRGIPDAFVARSATTGRDLPPAAFQTRLTAFFESLKANDMGLRLLHPVDDNQVSLVNIVSINGALQPGKAKITTDRPHLAQRGDRVIIRQTDRKLFPGLLGSFTVLERDTNFVIVPYQVAQDENFATAVGKLKLEKYDPVVIFDPPKCGFDHYGTRDTRNSFSHSRGAKRAARIRPLA